MNYFKLNNMGQLMEDKKSYYIKEVQNQKGILCNTSFKANAFCNKGSNNFVLQGYIVDDFFIDIKTKEIFEKTFFYMINNIEEDEANEL